MPARKQTIAAAEKKAIKAEISTLKKNHRLATRDLNTSTRIIDREIKKLSSLHNRRLASTTREQAKINRRLAILQARL